MKCKYCGHEVPFGSHYCEECGATVEEESNAINLAKNSDDQTTINNSEMLDIGAPDPRYSQQNNNQGYGTQPFGTQQQGYGQSGYSQDYSQTGYSSPNYSSQSGYGNTQQSGYGQTGYGSQNYSSQNGYNNTQQSGYGQTGYGSQNYGSQSGYKSTQQSGYGQPVYGQTGYNQTGYNTQPYGGNPYGFNASYGNGYNMTDGSPRYVGISEAIRLFFKNYANFSGRSTRSEFWWVQLFLTLIYLVLALLVAVVGAAVEGSSGDGTAAVSGIIILFIIIALALVIPTLSLSIRRLHDIGKSGVFYCVSFIPYVGGFILLVFYCMPSVGANEYGPAADPNRSQSF